MAAVIPDVAKPVMAQILADDSVADSWQAALYQNDYTPDHTTTLADLTEATFSGYVEVTLTTPVVAGSLDASGRAVITWDKIVWIKVGATVNQIYGYYVMDGSGNLLWAERAATPPLRMSADNDEIDITPVLTLKSEFFNT